MSITYGVGLDTTVEKLNLEVRFRLTSRFGHKGLRTLYRIIKDSDLDNSGDLSRKEFETALNKIGVFFKKFESTAMFLYYDKNGDGRINYEEFLDSFRCEPSARRMALVNKVFRAIDLNKDGKVSLEEAEIFYRPEKVNQNYIQGNIGKKDAVGEFFSYLKLDDEGYCTYQEFCNFYKDVSSVVGKDENFINILNETWGINEDEFEASSCIISDHVKLLREKLINKTKGVLDEYKLASMFKEYDVEKAEL